MLDLVFQCFQLCLVLRIGGPRFQRFATLVVIFGDEDILLAYLFAPFQLFKPK